MLVSWPFSGYLQISNRHLNLFHNREPAMKTIAALMLAVLLFAPLSAHAHEDEGRHHTKEQLKTDPKAFEGTWSGIWDYCWHVEFQIKHVADDQFTCIYRWQENTESQEMKQNTLKGRVKNGVLKIGAISIEFKDEHQLLAIGRFRKFTRVAFLHEGPVTFEQEHEDPKDADHKH
ncbi:MAG: hypothetical protein CMJ19_04080 [Phycisphaeraceae bacterium]|nr:hypothetical protein [Phycisphaeraceae bacterium]